jgi:hypothetical protein
VEQARSAGLTYAVWDTPGTDSQIQVPSERVGPTVVLALAEAGATFNRDLRVLLSQTVDYRVKK